MTPKDPKESYEPKIVGDNLISIYPLKRYTDAHESS